jgi:hypothetical protein
MNILTHHRTPKTVGKKLFRKYRLRWKENVTINHEEMDCEDVK